MTYEKPADYPPRFEDVTFKLNASPVGEYTRANLLPPIKERTGPIAWEETARKLGVLMHTVVCRAMVEISKNMGDEITHVSSNNDFDTYDLRFDGFCRSGDMIEITIKRQGSKK